MTIFELDYIEKASIRAFLESVEWEGEVLDYGCGQQPYRELIEMAGSDYVPYDRVEFLGSTVRDDIGDLSMGGLDCAFEMILCTQVIQYVPDVVECLEWFRSSLGPSHGLLVLTYPSTWPVIRDELWHFTKAGMELLLRQAGFEILRHELRASIPMDGFELPIGYGVVAKA